MMIYPAIDLREGRCVRLAQGRKEKQTVYSDSPAAQAQSFAAEGAQYLHIVDLDGAFAGEPRNHDAIRAIAQAVGIPFQVGGGLRTVEAVQAVLELGAARVVIGTKAVQSPDFIADLLARFGAECIVLGLDAKDGMVATHGWEQASEQRVEEFAVTMRQLGLKRAICTDVSRDGLLQGPNVDSLQRVAAASGLEIIASGGVGTLEHVRELRRLEAQGISGVIIGKALYEKKFTLSAAITAGRGE
ncbi:MAG: 1-(5-phosphoribosyl)-5-[(5-phosphoribosylamino)methylideneamino]imidazole-4-carboxamide isomerase [Syntrophomonadaceae bacterium]|nr:1-(5-phosphoribosyl)-5-[(5-phosphoribosylamino)methylideneamino]imidazole-4-carboxamide isomerase [Syntrophomonadaceae bacterium]